MDLRRRGFENVLQDDTAGMIVLTYDFANREQNLVSQYDAALTTISSPDR
jgi:hypothetical protein